MLIFCDLFIICWVFVVDKLIYVIMLSLTFLVILSLFSYIKVNKYNFLVIYMCVYMPLKMLLYPTKSKRDNDSIHHYQTM